jgi:hypothetical protein
MRSSAVGPNRAVDRSSAPPPRSCQPLYSSWNCGHDVKWHLVLATALAARKLLADEGYNCGPKLTGVLPVMVPIDRALTHKQVHTCPGAGGQLRDPRDLIAAGDGLRRKEQILDRIWLPA